MLNLSGRNLERKHVILYRYQIDRVQGIATAANISFAEALRDIVDRGLLSEHDNMGAAADRRTMLDAAATVERRRLSVVD